MNRVVLADDQKSVRLGLRLLLEEEDGIEITGEAYNAGSLLTNVAPNPPDLVLLDWGLPGMDSEHLIGILRKLCPNMAICILSGAASVKEAALLAGANAYFCKANSPDQLVETIQSVLDIKSSGDEK